jgi:hypothetical protein
MRRNAPLFNQFLPGATTRETGKHESGNAHGETLLREHPLNVEDRGPLVHAKHHIIEKRL